MPPSFSTTSSAVVVTGQDLVTSALLELGVTAAGEAPAPDDTSWGLEKLQRLIDQWNARKELIFSTNFLQFTLTPNHDPHTIGPNGDFNLPYRPVEIVTANYILNAGSNPVDVPINLRDDAWWADNPLKSLVSTIPTNLYYDAASPLGNAHFWPIVSAAIPVRLQVWSTLTQAVDLQTKLGFVQGYWDAIVSDLAVRLAPSFERSVSPELREQWSRGMRIIEQNNGGLPPRIDTSGGLPNSGRGGRPDFNFLTGLRE